MKRGSHSWVHRSHDRKPYLESIAAFLNKELTQQLLFLSLWMSRSSLVSSRSSTFHLVTVLQVRWKDFFTFTLSLSQKLRMNVFLCFFAQNIQQIMICFWTPTFGNIYMVSIGHGISLFWGPSMQGKKQKCLWFISNTKDTSWDISISQ